jgi:hypothetical protein
MNSGEPTGAIPLKALKTSAEIAVVGPDTMIIDEPKRAAITGVTIAVYSPYSGGRPAMAANATA